jgi:quercetin dioxygenase-like cupin family protein
MPEIERWDVEEDGPVTERRLLEALEDRGYSVSRHVYPPGTRFPSHTHDVDKIDAVVSGRFRIALEGEDVVLGPGDAVEVPRGVEHTAEVVGDEPVVSLDGARR